MDNFDNMQSKTPCGDTPPDRSADRRRVIGIGISGLLLAPLGNFLLSRNTEARGSTGVTSISKEISRLPESDPQATALGYIEHKTESSPEKSDTNGNSSCRNCQLYSGIPDEQWGPCAIFSYRTNPLLNKPYVVSADGWCISWAPRNLRKDWQPWNTETRRNSWRPISRSLKHGNMDQCAKGGRKVSEAGESRS
jgi:hypothetical protein